MILRVRLEKAKSSSKHKTESTEAGIVTRLLLAKRCHPYTLARCKSSFAHRRPVGFCNPSETDTNTLRNIGSLLFRPIGLIRFRTPWRPGEWLQSVQDLIAAGF